MFYSLCHGRHRIHHGAPIWRKMVTLRLNLGSFSLSKLCEKLPKSIPLVTIFLFIGTPWWILYILYQCALDGLIRYLLCLVKVV